MLKYDVHYLRYCIKIEIIWKGHGGNCAESSISAAKERLKTLLCASMIEFIIDIIDLGEMDLFSMTIMK